MKNVLGPPGKTVLGPRACTFKIRARWVLGSALRALVSALAHRRSAPPRTHGGRMSTSRPPAEIAVQPAENAVQ
jgi:hypothetical protein